MRKLVLDGTARLLAGPHPERARQDAEMLLLHVLDKGKAWLMAHGDEMLADGLVDRYSGMLERRSLGEPIQYITGEAEFYGLPFRVSGDVLIPRPETEHLVEKILELASAFPHPRIVDVGTGSGAIAVALAHKWPSAEMTAIDISAAALAIAQENAHRNDATIRFLEGDLLAPVVAEKFDFVVSNPPYVPETDRASLSVEVREYEPGLALFAGDDGLTIYRRLIPAAYFVLAPGGFVLLEIGYGQEAAIRTLLQEVGFAQIEFVPDLQGISRVACGRRLS